MWFFKAILIFLQLSGFWGCFEREKGIFGCAQWKLDKQSSHALKMQRKNDWPLAAMHWISKFISPPLFVRYECYSTIFIPELWSTSTWSYHTQQARNIHTGPYNKRCNTQRKTSIQTTKWKETNIGAVFSCVCVFLNKSCFQLKQLGCKCYQPGVVSV